MADSVPNMDLSKQSLKRHILEQQVAVERGKEAILELADRKKRNAVNRVAALAAIVALDEQLANDGTAIDRQRTKLQIAAQRHTIERQVLEDMEGADRIAQILETIKASEGSRKGFEQKLAGIEQTHGVLTDVIFERLLAEAIA